MGHFRPKADAAEPGLIADAVFDGHLAARNFERDDGAAEKEFYIKEIISLEQLLLILLGWRSQSGRGI